MSSARRTTARRCGSRAKGRSAPAAASSASFPAAWARGAGRKMSRNAAQKAFSTADLEKQTEGVICRKDKGVLDEIPGAYKNIDEVMANQSDLVEVVHKLKQVLCVKG